MMTKICLLTLLLGGGCLEIHAQSIDTSAYPYSDSKKMMAEYRFCFLADCTQNYLVEPAQWVDEVCDYMHLGLDKRSMIEIDSLSEVVRLEIESMLTLIDEKGISDLLPDRICVLQYCYKKSESEGVNSLAQSFANRMKGIAPWRYWEY